MGIKVVPLDIIIWDEKDEINIGHDEVDSGMTYVLFAVNRNIFKAKFLTISKYGVRSKNPLAQVS